MKLSTIIRNYIKADSELQNLESKIQELEEEKSNTSLCNSEYEELKWAIREAGDEAAKLHKKIEKIDTLFYGFEPTEEEFDNCVDKALQVLKLTPAEYALENLYYSNWY